MRILVTGATGFIGRALVLRLLRDGHEIVAWSRSPRDRDRLGAEVERVDASGGEAALAKALARCEGVVNLAGAPILGRWSRARKEAMIESRVGTTRMLVRAMGAAEHGGTGCACSSRAAQSASMARTAATSS